MRALNEHIAKDGFRLRGLAMSRIDGFSDVVFGFALTLLVVSLEVPKTFNELNQVVLGFLPFALGFAFLIMLWLEHYTFFRRFGLEDAGTICLNAVLLFLVLFFVYPVKFLFALTVPRHEGPPAFANPAQVTELMLLYGLGFALIYWTYAALYTRAFSLREELALTPLELLLTRLEIIEDLLIGSVGALSAIVALALPPNLAGLAGFLFGLIGPVKSTMGRIKRKRAANLPHSPSPAFFLAGQPGTTEPADKIKD